MRGGTEPRGNLREWLPKEFVVEFNQGLDGMKFGLVDNNSRVTRIISVPEGSKGYLAGVRVNDLLVGVNDARKEDLCTILKNINRGKSKNKSFKLRVRKMEDPLAEEAGERHTVASLSPLSIGSPMSLDCSLNSFWENTEVKLQRSLSFNVPSRAEDRSYKSQQLDAPCFFDENSLFGLSPLM